MRWTRSAPDLSSLSERVSDTVSTAIFSGTNCLVSSMPGMAGSLCADRHNRRVEATDGCELRLSGRRLATPRRFGRRRACPTASALARSELIRLERVAGRDLPRLEALHEPALALRRGAMREGVGHHIALRLPLQAVVADGGGGLQRLVDIAGIEEIAPLLGAIGPDAGKAVGLQLDAHLQ